jgi:hypothetical protein
MQGLRPWACGVAIFACGCASAPPLENPVLVHSAAGTTENPILVAPGAPSAESYAEIYEAVLDVMDNYFEIKPTSRYAGHIETHPAIAHGYDQPWKPGSPDPRHRLVATFQSMRNYATVDIWTGERGGYRVYVEVYRELEDVPAPVNGGTPVQATFRDRPNVDRSFEVVGNESTPTRKWIPQGRDYAFEQMLLREIRERAMSCNSCK